MSDRNILGPEDSVCIFVSIFWSFHFPVVNVQGDTKRFAEIERPKVNMLAHDVIPFEQEIIQLVDMLSIGFTSPFLLMLAAMLFSLVVVGIVVMPIWRRRS